MQRIKLGKPYEDYIARQIKSGYFSTATEILRDSLRSKMSQEEQDRINTIHQLIEEGRKSPRKPFTKKLLKDIFNKAKEKAKNGAPIPDHVKP